MNAPGFNVGAPSYLAKPTVTADDVVKDLVRCGYLKSADLADRFGNPATLNPAQATAYIANPFAGQRSQFARFTASHPPMEDRIARLRSGEWQN